MADNHFETIWVQRWMSRGGWTTRVPARQLSLQSAFQSAGSGNSNVCNVVLYAPTCCAHTCTYMHFSTRSHPALLSSPLPFILFSLADACLIDQICCRARSTPSVTSTWQAWYGTPSKHARIITYARPDDKTAEELGEDSSEFADGHYEACPALDQARSSS